MPSPVLLLCLLLIIGQPISVGLAASRALDALAFRGTPAVLVLALRLLVAAFGVAAGRSLLARRHGALKLAKAALVIAAATDVFVLLTPYFPTNRAPGETPIFVVLSLGYYSAWFAYLTCSRRVREAFS